MKHSSSVVCDSSHTHTQLSVLRVQKCHMLARLASPSILFAVLILIAVESIDHAISPTWGTQWEREQRGPEGWGCESACVCFCLFVCLSLKRGPDDCHHPERIARHYVMFMHWSSNVCFENIFIYYYEADFKGSSWWLADIKKKRKPTAHLADPPRKLLQCCCFMGSVVAFLLSSAEWKEVRSLTAKPEKREKKNKNNGAHNSLTWRDTDTLEDAQPLFSFHGSASRKKMWTTGLLCVYIWKWWKDTISVRRTADVHKQVHTDVCVCVCFVSGEWFWNLLWALESAHPNW